MMMNSARQKTESPPKSFHHRAFGTLRQWCPWLLMLSVLLVASYGIAKYVIWPGYTNPQSRIYASRLGYPAVMRQRNQPFPVVTCRPEIRPLVEYFVGEGFIRSTPILVPIIPTSRIRRVNVNEGETVRKGQLLAELDKSNALVRLESARVMLEVAEAELERTKIGSSYLLEKERPEKDKIRVKAAQEHVVIRDELEQMAVTLFQNKVISKTELLRQRAAMIDTLAQLREAEVSLQQSQRGRAQSIRIAAATVREAELAVAQRELELAEHDVWAPADGTIERRLVQQGEYNQDPGKPGFLLASGQWFGAYFDQTVMGKLTVGDPCRIHLEAFAGSDLEGHIVSIHPFVSFNSAGPETTRPIRPSGTGSPEWPSTFSVRIRLQPNDLTIATGLSGLARVERLRETLAVPSSAVSSVSASKGWVLITDGHRFKRREVALGSRAGGWTEINAGLTNQDQVIVEGHQDLQAGDRITIQSQPVPKVSASP
jgi:HlyD family secretion protein